MPVDSIIVPKQAAIAVALEPVSNLNCSLMLLNETSQLPGLNSRLVDIYRLMTEEERLNNRIATRGLVFCYLSIRNWPDVSGYLASLADTRPEEFRDKLFERYAEMILQKNTLGNPGAGQPVPIDQEQVLKSEDAYLDFIKNNFDIRHADFEAEALCHEYLIDPPKLKAFLISHLTNMWESYLRKEWDKNQTMLEESVAAFQRLDLTNRERLEAIQTVTTHQIEEEWQEWPWKIEWLRRASRVVLVPSAHLGPYSVKMSADNTFFIFYGARLPEGTRTGTSDLNRNEINVRLNALADDTRLRMLKLIVDHGEQSSQEIMNRLGLSQSAASRHLKQLSATGFLKERRQTSAKIYDLNTDFTDKTITALSLFLQKKQ